MNIGDIYYRNDYNETYKLLITHSDLVKYNLFIRYYYTFLTDIFRGEL